MVNIFKTITDIATILFPAVIAIFGFLHLTGAIGIATIVEQIIMILLGAASAIASIIYNQLVKKVE